MKVGVIGFGYWGPKMVRNLMGCPDTDLSAIADHSTERLEVAGRMAPGVTLYKGHAELLADGSLDAVVVCTPPHSHVEVTSMALGHGKHVLVEKPAGCNTVEVRGLIDLALQRNLTLMVDYTFLFSGPVRRLVELVKGNTLGPIRFIDSTRVNLGIFQENTNVLWDLAIHDLSIIYRLSDERPKSVQAIGTSHRQRGVADIAYLTLEYESGLLVHIHDSWSSPVKMRQMVVGGTNATVIYDDIEPTDKLKVYPHEHLNPESLTKDDALTDYRIGEILIPKFAVKEALAEVVEEFAGRCSGVRRPLVDHQFTLDVTHTIVQANESLRLGGEKIML